MTVPPHLQYTEAHEWVDRNGDIATVGVTEFATNALGDIVYLDLPETRTVVIAGEVCGEIESTKSVSDLFAPVGGEVTDVNQFATEDPAVVNLAPSGAGWLFRVRVREWPDLIDAEEYGRLTNG